MFLVFSPFLCDLCFGGGVRFLKFRNADAKTKTRLEKVFQHGRDTFSSGVNFKELE